MFFCIYIIVCFCICIIVYICICIIVYICICIFFLYLYNYVFCICIIMYFCICIIVYDRFPSAQVTTCAAATAGWTDSKKLSLSRFSQKDHNILKRQKLLPRTMYPLPVLCDQTKQNDTNVKQPLLRRKKTIPKTYRQGYILHPNDII